MPKNIVTPPEVLNRLSLIYAGYRIFLSLFLAFLYFLSSSNPILGSNSPEVFLYSIVVYVISALIQYYALRFYLKQQQVQIICVLLIDVFVLSSLLYSNGGPSLQLSMLYLVVVMAASILLPASRAFAIALFAVITVVYQQFYFAISEQASISNISGALLLSLSFIGVSSLGQLATRRLQQVEIIANLRSKEIEQLQNINQRIIEEMQSGIVVINSDGIIVLVNHAAKTLLKSYHARPGQLFTKVSTALTSHIQQSLLLGQAESFFLPNIDPRLTEGLKLSCVRLDSDQADTMILIIMDDLAKTNQAAQQLKLASLGRLTAGIAHEIRNPLAAISQAGELLIESNRNPDDAVLLSIIQKQSLRINRIIEDILQLSRDAKSQPTQICFSEWLQPMLSEALPVVVPYLHVNYRLSQLTYNPETLTIRFDASQLQQVLVNLLSNAMHHAQKASDKPRIDMNIGVLREGLTYLDIVDNGVGITRDAEKNLFEPFFTTEAYGTGLGLYLSRAYCEANGASLTNVPTPKGAVFRIVFSRQVNA